MQCDLKYARDECLIIDLLFGQSVVLDSANQIIYLIIGEKKSKFYVEMISCYLIHFVCLINKSISKRKNVDKYIHHIKYTKKITKGNSYFKYMYCNNMNKLGSD